MISKIVVEMALLLGVQALTCGLMTMALNGGWLSENNLWEALGQGVIIYAVCRLLSLMPGVCGLPRKLMFGLYAGVGCFIFYINVLMVAAC